MITMRQAVDRIWATPSCARGNARTGAWLLPMDAYFTTMRLLSHPTCRASAG
jgi:hypothetical protein